MADKKTERDQRRAAALRENLKRRKAGARLESGDTGTGGRPLEVPEP